MRRILLAGLLLTGACLNATLPSPVASLLVSNNASPNGVFVGDQVQLNASALDISGNPVPIAVTYSSSNTTLAIITNDGLITALAPGTVAITIAAGGQNSHLNLTIDANVSTTVQVTPINPAIALGTQSTLTAVVITALNHPARSKTVVWSTTDATKVSVDQSGNITGVARTAGVSVCAAASDAPTAKGCTTVTVQ